MRFLKFFRDSHESWYWHRQLECRGFSRAFRSRFQERRLAGAETSPKVPRSHFNVVAIMERGLPPCCGSHSWSRFGLFLRLRFGTSLPRWRRHMTPRATRPRVTPPLTTNLHGPCNLDNPLTKPPGGSHKRLKRRQQQQVTRNGIIPILYSVVPYVNNC